MQHWGDFFLPGNLGQISAQRRFRQGNTRYDKPDKRLPAPL